MKKIQFEGYEIYAIHQQQYESYGGAIKENQYLVLVKNINTGAKCSFRYWTGFTVCKLMKTNYDLIWAFQCFLGNAISGTYSFEEFCSECGYEMYDEDVEGYNRKSMQIHRACKKAYEKAIRILENDDELYRVYNKTIELENGDYELDKENVA